MWNYCFISLQTALEAASDYRKQVEENQGEKQQLVLAIKHDLNQVGFYIFRGLTVYNRWGGTAKIDKLINFILKDTSCFERKRTVCWIFTKTIGGNEGELPSGGEIRYAKNWESVVANLF